MHLSAYLMEKAICRPYPWWFVVERLCAWLALALLLAGCTQQPPTPPVDSWEEDVAADTFDLAAGQYNTQAFTLTEAATIRYVVTGHFVPLEADRIWLQGPMVQSRFDAWLAPGHACDDAERGEQLRSYSGSLQTNTSWAWRDIVLPQGEHCLVISNVGGIPGGAKGTSKVQGNYTIQARNAAGTIASVASRPFVPPTSELLVGWTLEYATDNNEVFTSIAHLPATLHVEPAPCIGPDCFAEPEREHFSAVELRNVGPAFYGHIEATFDGFASPVKQR